MSNNLLLTKRNDFINDILSYIIKTYVNDNDSLIILEDTAILFGKMQFNINKPFKGFEYLDDNGQIYSGSIKLALYYSEFNHFLKHLSTFGILCLKSLISYPLYDDIDLSLTVLYDPKVILPFMGENLFYKFLIDQKYKDLGKLALHLNLILIQDNSTLSNIPKALLSETIYGEYIKELDIFCFNYSRNLNPYNTLCLDWIIQYCKVFNNSKQIDSCNGEYLDIEKSIELLLDNKDKLIIKPLKVKQEKITTSTACTICLENIEQAGFKTSCGHHFHCDCVVLLLQKYYTDLYTSCLEDRSLMLEYDMQGDVIQGAPYNFSCPNCKRECFKLDCARVDNMVIIKNPENCIFEI